MTKRKNLKYGLLTHSEFLSNTGLNMSARKVGLLHNKETDEVVNWSYIKNIITKDLNP